MKSSQQSTVKDKAKHQCTKSKIFQQKARHACKTSVARSFLRQIQKEMLHWMTAKEYILYIMSLFLYEANF